MRETVPSPAFATHTASFVDSDGDGLFSDRDLTRRVRARIDPRHEVVTAAGDPDRVVPVRDPG